MRRARRVLRCTAAPTALANSRLAACFSHVQRRDRMDARSMDYLIGLILAPAVCVAARLAGFDRERGFYPVVLIVIASYYVLFAVMGGDSMIILLESAVGAAFLAAALAGFKTRLWILVPALAAHGVFDFFHPLLLQNARVPVWWPPFCLAFDLGAALFLGVLLLRGTGPGSFSAR